LSGPIDRFGTVSGDGRPRRALRRSRHPPATGAPALCG